MREASGHTIAKALNPMHLLCLCSKVPYVQNLSTILTGQGHGSQWKGDEAR